jgi:hypothetical protein
MTDAYATLREMLTNVPDDAQVYVEELESIVEWPGITAGTFRALLAEIAGFEWGWEQREKAHDAEVATLTAQLAEQKEYFNRCDERRNELAGECQMLRAQLAEARKERDMARIARDVWMIQARGDCGDAGELHATAVRAEILREVRGVVEGMDDGYGTNPGYSEYPIGFEEAITKVLAAIAALAQPEGTK